MKLTGIVLAMVFVVTGCGAQQAMDATASMPEKMDNTLDQIKKTNAKMDETNSTIEQQPVQISFEDMLKPEMGQDLLPIPFDLMPFAQKFGQYVSPDDFIQVVYLWMKKLNELTLDAATPTADQIAAFNHHKLQTFMALEAICGFLPEAKMNQIVSDQIDHDGRYKDSAMQMLMLRVRFLRDVMLEASLFATPLDDVGKLEKAVEYANSIDVIARLPFAKQLSINVTGFLAPIPAVQETLDPALALQEWNKINSKAARSLNIAPEVLTGNSSEDQKLYVDRQNRMNAAMKIVDQKILSWGGKP